MWCWLVAGCAVAAGLARAQNGAPARTVVKPSAAAVRKDCSAAVLEGEVVYGQSYSALFTKGLEFKLEAIASGWMVRVLPVGRPRPAEDNAELATLPYRSVTPLAVSTDYAFRAQDAVAWNPRRFRYAAREADAKRLAELFPRVLAGDAKASAEAAELTERQPAAELQLLGAELAPGTADQWKMAAAVASHLQAIPHEVAQGVPTSPLGRVTRLRFRARLELAPESVAAPGVRLEPVACVW